MYGVAVFLEAHLIVFIVIEMFAFQTVLLTQ